MNEVNKTLYIPLFGKSYVSEKGIILSDKMAENIWQKAGFKLKGKSKSKWLAYYMGMRARVFDDWLGDKITENPCCVVIHLGCGLDSRVMRVKQDSALWYDVDFPDVIAERRKFYREDEKYKMLPYDIRKKEWLDSVEKSTSAVVVMEGISMYLDPYELSAVLSMLCSRFEKLSILMDCYTTFAAKASKIKNPINDVGVTKVYGMDDPLSLEKSGISFVKEWDMTPGYLIDELLGMEKSIFSKVYGGKMSRKLYKLYEYTK